MLSINKPKNRHVEHNIDAHALAKSLQLDFERNSLTSPRDIRRRFIIITSWLMVVAIPALYLIRSQLGATASHTGSLVITGSTLFFAVAVYQHVHSETNLGSVLLFSTFSTLILAFTLINGAINAPVLALVPILPVSAVFLFGVRKGVFITAFIVSTVLFVSFLYANGTSIGEPSVQGKEWGVARGLMVSWTCILLLLIVWAYERQHRALIGALHHGATHDPLTGVANRTALSTSLENAASDYGNNKRPKGPLSVIIFDIDNFKQHNDVEGHQAGDRILQTIARCARESALRKTDLVARFGGDEFVIVLPDTSGHDAINVALRLRQLVSETEMPFAANASVTLSMGVACSNTEKGNRLAHKLLNKADSALYQAKEAGRNCIVVSSPTNRTSPISTAKDVEKFPQVPDALLQGAFA